MPGTKRTYSNKNRAIMDQNGPSKRSKFLSAEDGELRWPKSTPRRPQQSSSLLKRGLSKHSGPVSFAEDLDSESSIVFDNTAQGKLKPVTKKSKKTYSNKADIQDVMDYGPATTTKCGRVSGQLPTPPIELQTQQKDRAAQLFANRNNVSTNLATQVTTSAWKRATTPNTSETSSESTDSKRSHALKQYQSDKANAPRRDLLGNWLSSKSTEAKLWLTNQKNSPFLRLPTEVRNRIYEKALGGNTILIDYQTYNSTEDRVKPVFKYNCTVYNKSVNPFLERHSAHTKITSGFTLLSNICRQLYLETNVMACKLNLLAFTTQNFMANFVMLEHRFSPSQRQAVKKLALNHEPGANIFEFLPNVEEVYLACNMGPNLPRGWYRVVRDKGGRPKLQAKHLS